MSGKTWLICWNWLNWPWFQRNDWQPKKNLAAVRYWKVLDITRPNRYRSTSTQWANNNVAQDVWTTSLWNRDSVRRVFYFREWTWLSMFMCKCIKSRVCRVGFIGPTLKLVVLEWWFLYRNNSVSFLLGVDNFLNRVTLCHCNILSRFGPGFFYHEGKFQMGK